MWRFLKNVDNPTEKRNDKKRNYDQQYDNSKRRRTFRDEWKQEFRWLSHDETEGVMFCVWCRELCKTSDRGNLFIKGTSNFRIDSVKSHQKSDSHKSCEAQNNANRMKPGTSQAERMLSSMNKSVIKKLEILFRNAHAVGKQCRPFTDYTWMCNLDEAKGLSVGPSYRTDKAAQCFIHFIAEVEKEKLQAVIEDVDYISLISDGTTDLSVTEAEIVYVQYSCNGNRHTDLVGIRNVSSTTAISIKEAILDCIQTHLNISPSVLEKKLVGFGSDGASVMLGKNNGVAELLKDQFPSLQAVIHCTAHRLELAFKDAVKQVPLYVSLDTLLLNLYLFYKNSSKNRSGLKLAGEACHQSQRGFIPTRVGGTRWLPHLQRALKQVINGYKPLQLHLNQLAVQRGVSVEAQSKSKNFRKQLCRKDIVLLLHFMLDIVQLLSKVSFTAQLSSSTVADVAASIESASAVLSDYKERKMTPRLEELKDIGTEYKGETLVGTGDIQSSIVNIIKNIEKSLDGRFRDMKHGLLNSLKISSFKFWPLNVNSSKDFGNEDITLLRKTFSESLTAANVSVDELPLEWNLLKKKVYARYNNVCDARWEEIIPAVKEELPNISSLVNLILAIPASSAKAERGFSLMKRVKTKYRTSLQDDRVSDQMIVMMQSAPISEFDPLPAINLWNNGVIRRTSKMEDNEISVAEFDESPVSDSDESSIMSELSDSDF